jgi:ubiquitin carboxyl-terminal hydrolase 9/13
VTIIRTPATWLVFDDETVEPIKESEITKYFGESNSGSAYVLYYQAVDLDLAALGLRPAAPVPVSEYDEVPKRHSFEPPASSPVAAPSLPPGLADDMDTSDISDPPPFPITPSQPSPMVPFLDSAPHGSAPSQPLRVNVSSPDDDIPTFSGSPSNSPTSASAGTKVGLFQSLRHSPSMKIRGQGSGSGAGVERGKSLRDRIVHPATAISLPKHEDLPDLPPTPLQAPVINNKDTEPEKVKEPERRASVWFKRRSGRADKRPGTASGTLTSPDLGGDVISPSSSPSTTWFRNNAPTTTEFFKTRRPSEPALNDVGAFRSLLTSSSKTSSPKKSHTPKHSIDLHRDHKNGYDSPSPASATSSFASSSTQPTDIPSTTTSLPTIPASPHGPSIRQALNIHSTASPPSPRSPIERKQSQPHLKMKKSKELNSPSSPRVPARPSTAGAGMGGRTGSSEPEPPLPPLPSFARTHRRRASNDQASDTTHSTNSEGRPNSAYMIPEVGADPTFGRDARAMGSSNHVTAPLKRPSRKLSLSSPILGFVMKEKTKEKEKTFLYEKAAERSAKEKEKAAKTRAKEVEKEEKARLKAEARKREQEELALTSSAFPTFALASRI